MKRGMTRAPAPRSYAMKTLEKAEMMERNKVQRVLAEAAILAKVDHPFLASLWGTIQTKTHLHFLMEVCHGGELYALLTSQPHKRFPEAQMQFYAAEVSPSSRALTGSVWTLHESACASRVGLDVAESHTHCLVGESACVT